VVNGPSATLRADGRKRIITVRREDIEKRFPGLLQAVLGSQ
jgi:hypothetical protein